MEKNWNSAYLVKAFARLPFDVVLQQKINAIYRDGSGRFDIYRRACGGSVDPVMIRRFARFLKVRREDFYFRDNLSALGSIPTADDHAARLYIIGRRRGVVIHWDRATAARCADPSGRMGVIRENKL